MATRSQRATAMILALLFLLSSIATTAYVIWQINSEEPVATGQEEETPLDQSQLQGTPLQGFNPRTEPVASLESTDLVVGTGAEAVATSKVTVNYTGALVSDGLIFESSLDSGQPASFGLAEVIPGWTQGVPGMKVGGKRRLVIPYALAYGEAGSPPTIPERADLVFDIELLAVE